MRGLLISILRSLRALFTQSHLILERLHEMPDIVTFRTAMATLKQFISGQFDGLDADIKSDFAKVIAGLPESVPQEVLDSLVDLQNTISSRITSSQSAADAQVPVVVAPPPPSVS